MRKRILTLMLVLCTVVSLLIMPTNTSAATAGTCGGDLVWTLDDDGTLIISGERDMDEWNDVSEVLWNSLSSSITRVTIGDDVTTINAFASCYNIESVEIGDSICRIDEYAFAGCKSLKSITIPDSVTSIGSSAFESCEKMTNIKISDNIR